MERPTFAWPSAPWAIIATLMAIAWCVYAPGLHGGFIYDDSSFIVANSLVHVTTTDLRDWAAAAFSFPGGVRQGRWLGMLSFAANHYSSGLDPYWFKWTNLVIHLVNGLLVFLALRALFDLHRECAGEQGVPPAFSGLMAAAAIAGLWLVLPINLTAVLYASQRLESLSNTFVFLGLWWYLRARLRHWHGVPGTWGLWTSLIACTGAGVLIKESAILLPLYAACTEWVLARGRNAAGDRSRTVHALYASILVVPLVIGLAWLASWIFGPTTYAHSYNTSQRLLTESRVLFDYIGWTLAPSLDALTLYHDDIQASRGLLDPPSTLAACAGIAALLAVALWQRKDRPLFSLGIAWFFCGHLLTATVIPLLLAFEHRNYFPSVGLILAAASVVALEKGLKAPRLRIAMCLAIGVFYALTTWMRANEWSDPVRLVFSEASKRPRSPLAQYDRAATLVRLGTLEGHAVPDDALLALDEHRNLAGAGISFEQALITLSIDGGLTVNPDWYAAILRKLREGPASVQDAKALQNLNECFANKRCGEDPSFLDAAYAAAMSFPHPSPVLLYAHSQFVAFLKGDYARAEMDLREVVALSPYDSAARRALVTILIRRGERAEAIRQVGEIRKINYFGVLDSTIAGIESELGNQ